MAAFSKLHGTQRGPLGMTCCEGENPSFCSVQCEASYCSSMLFSGAAKTCPFKVQGLSSHYYVNQKLLIINCASLPLHNLSKSLPYIFLLKKTGQIWTQGNALCGCLQVCHQFSELSHIQKACAENTQRTRQDYTRIDS